MADNSGTLESTAVEISTKSEVTNVCCFPLLCIAISLIFCSSYLLRVQLRSLWGKQMKKLQDIIMAAGSGTLNGFKYWPQQNFILSASVLLLPFKEL